MSRKPKTPDYQKQKLTTGNDKHFARLFKTMLYSEAFTSMPSGAKALLPYMVLASNGKAKFTFPFTAYTQIGMDKKTFHRNKEVLLDHGFIDEEHHCTSSNVYNLSDRWKTWSKTK